MTDLSRRAFLSSLAAIAGATTLPVAALAAVIEPEPLEDFEPQVAEQQVDDDEVSSQPYYRHRRRVVRRVYRRGYRRGYYGGGYGYGYPSGYYGGGYYRPGYGTVYRHRRRVVRRAYRRRW